jgi:DNA-binding MarR family transcriptional regulator
MVVQSQPDPRALDLGQLALFAGLALGDEILRELQRTAPRVRFAHGVVFQHLVNGPRSIQELARLLEVTQQAASKRVAELVRLGFVTARADPADKRARVIALSSRGRALIEAARAARRRQDARLARRHAARDLATTRRVLARILSDTGAAEAIRQRRVRWPT